MILAAGHGERLRPITDSIPKALVEVRGKSLLERHLQAIRSAGVDTVVINLGWHGEQIVERVGSGSGFGLNVIYSPEGDDILETGGGIHRALPMLGDEPFLVVNTDIYTDMPLHAAALGDDEVGHLVLVRTSPDKHGGDFDLVDRLVRNGDIPDLTFSGVATYRPEFFAACEPGRFSVVPMLRAAADAGNLSGSIYTGLWTDVGTPDKLYDQPDNDFVAGLVGSPRMNFVSAVRRDVDGAAGVELPFCEIAGGPWAKALDAFPVGCIVCHEEKVSHNTLTTAMPQDHFLEMSCRECHGNGTAFAHPDPGHDCSICHK